MSDHGTGAARSGFFLLVFSISLATFMSGLDGTIVNIAPAGSPGPEKKKS